MATERHRDLSNGTLSVRSFLEDGIHRLALCGELDLANAVIVEVELTAAMAAADARVVIDLSELEFIDSSGIALLVTALGRCGGSRQMHFVPSRSAAVNRVLALTGVAERLPLAESGTAK